MWVSLKPRRHRPQPVGAPRDPAAQPPLEAAAVQVHLPRPERIPASAEEERGDAVEPGER